MFSTLPSPPLSFVFYLFPLVTFLISPMFVIDTGVAAISFPLLSFFSPFSTVSSFTLQALPSPIP